VRIVAVAFYESPWFRAVVYVALALAAARVVDYLLARRDRAMVRILGKPPDPADRTRFLMIRRLIQAAIVVVGVAIALFQFTYFSSLAGAILASAAIIAGILGIASRAPLANLVSGVMIAFSQPVRLGDYISVGEVYGTVEEIRFTYTFIRTADESRVVIPNEAFASQVVHNYSLGSPGSMISVAFVVPLGADLDEVREAALQVADELAPAPNGKSSLVVVEALGSADVSLRLTAWTLDPLRRRTLASDLRVALVRRLLADGVLPGRDEAGGAG